MNKLQIALCFGALVLASAAADAQTNVRVRGTITAFAGTMLLVKSGEGKNVDIQLAEKTVIVFTQPIALGDIKPGDFLGVTSMKRNDSTLTAVEVRRMPRPINPGHRPFDGRDDQTMTNATVSATVESAGGRELTLTYEGGSQKIAVPESASISMLAPGARRDREPYRRARRRRQADRAAHPGEPGQIIAVGLFTRSPHTPGRQT